MTVLSVNLNKIALLRNSRGRDYPNVVEFAKQFIQLGAKGITIHPRQDERHITRQDTHDLSQLLTDYADVEFNVEGYPSEDFLRLVEDTKPDQCTFVPDAPDQLTSDHGWDVNKHKTLLTDICARLSQQGIRTALFLDPNPTLIPDVVATGADRIELYTEQYATHFSNNYFDHILKAYSDTAIAAQKNNIGVNAGHDLDLTNLGTFLQIENILEVSIGHVLTIECIQQGMDKVIKQYLDICHSSA